MNRKRRLVLSSIALLVVGAVGAQAPAPAARTGPAAAASAQAGDGVGIQWFATLERGLAEAKRAGKPILFVSAAPHCAGVSGMW